MCGGCSTHTAAKVLQLQQDAPTSRSSAGRKVRAPGDPSTTSRAASACAAPAIILGTKSRWPGASISVTAYRSVANRVVATSTVTPRARSSGLCTVCTARSGCCFTGVRRHSQEWVYCEVTACPGFYMPSGRLRVDPSCLSSTCPW